MGSASPELIQAKCKAKRTECMTWRACTGCCHSNKYYLSCSSVVLNCWIFTRFVFRIFPSFAIYAYVHPTVRWMLHYEVVRKVLYSRQQCDCYPIVSMCVRVQQPGWDRDEFSNPLTFSATTPTTLCDMVRQADDNATLPHSCVVRMNPSNEETKARSRRRRRRVWILWDYEQQRQCKMETKNERKEKMKWKKWCERTCSRGECAWHIRVTRRPHWNDVATTMCTIAKRLQRMKFKCKIHNNSMVLCTHCARTQTDRHTRIRRTKNHPTNSANPTDKQMMRWDVRRCAKRKTKEPRTKCTWCSHSIFM